MFLRLRNGSTWQVIGSDNYSSLVGTPPAGIVFSEWARAQPAAWAYLAPILVENAGWALFITTPVGRNHAHSMYEMGRDDPTWFAELQTVNDSGAMTPAAVEQQRKEYTALFGTDVGNALIEQEYYCSFHTAVIGSYWSKEIAQAERDGRIGKVDIDRSHEVHTAWDLGVDDSMAIWCFQVGPGRINAIDYYENAGYGFDHYVGWLDERGYHGTDWVPHDAKVRELGAVGGRSRIETLFALGRKPRLVPNQGLMDGINAARKTLPFAHFDATRCKRGLECLRNYRAEWSEDDRTYRKTPTHNWASHGADAWRYLSLAWQPPAPPKEEEPSGPRFNKQGVWEITVDQLLELTDREIRIRV